MKRLLAALAIAGAIGLWGGAEPAHATCTGGVDGATGNGCVTQRGSIYDALGCQQITSLGSAATLTVPTGALRALLTVEGQSIRLRDDGTAPTASVGLLLPVGGPWPYNGPLSAVRIIQTAATATVDLCYYR